MTKFHMVFTIQSSLLLISGTTGGQIQHGDIGRDGKERQISSNSYSIQAFRAV